ncbi:MAG TPA: peroxiredoxin [Rhizomicrobium sp.]|nr:peroxiredoxin [Rhizomicrobium sp.]
MKILLGAAALLSLGLLANAADAALAVGTKAPDFDVKAALGGKEFDFSLDKALKKGPVVLYFFPAAFTPGCTIEAHDFAEATDRFNKLGATLIGVTAGNADRVTEFSSVECRNKFAVAADADQKVIKAYDVVLPKHPEYSSRTSYVIAPDRKIIFAYTDMAPDNHVALTMQAVEDWRDTHKRK